MATLGLRDSVRKWIRQAWLNRQDHAFHFIHIPKNGGMAVRHALALRGDVSLITPYHYRYVDVADQVGRDLRYFCIVRNPWSRTASRFMFGRQNAVKWPEKDPRRQYMARATFESFVKHRKILPIPEHPGQPWMGPLSSWFDQLDWIRDEQGRVACECLRLEHLDTDLSAYFGGRIKLFRRNETRTRYDYRAMYTDELIEIVAQIFRDDIAYFGFQFEGPATRNIAVL